MSIQDNLTKEAKYVKDVANNLCKIKTYTIRNKDGSTLPYPDIEHAAHVATAAYQEDGYKLLEWYKDYIAFINWLGNFRILFLKGFKTVYNSTSITTDKIKKIGDMPTAKELYDLWQLDSEGVLYTNNFPWYKTWLKEMTFDDSILIRQLNLRQHYNNRIAYNGAKTDRKTLCDTYKKDLNDYVIYRELTKVKADGTIDRIKNEKKIMSEGDDWDE